MLASRRIAVAIALVAGASLPFLSCGVGDIATGDDAGARPDAQGLDASGNKDAAPRDAQGEDASNLDAGSDGGRDYSSDKSKFFGASRCAQANVQLCEDFESGALDTSTW